jgi:hypothetical protein
LGLLESSLSYRFVPSDGGSFTWVTRFSPRSALGRRIMGSGEQSVSICFTTLQILSICRFETLNEIALPIVPTGTIQFTLRMNVCLAWLSGVVVERDNR